MRAGADDRIHFAVDEDGALQDRSGAPRHAGGEALMEWLCLRYRAVIEPADDLNGCPNCSDAKGIPGMVPQRGLGGPRMSWRRFVGALALLLVLATRAAAQPAVPQWPGDFTYLGSTVVPSAPSGTPSNGDSNYGRGLAIRIEADGHVTLFIGSWNPQVILRWEAPRNADGTFSAPATFKANLGTVPINNVLFGLYWDLPTQTLYASSQSEYDADPAINMTLGRATIDPTTGTLVAAGRFRFRGRSDKFTQGGVAALPAWFQHAYHCGRLVVGWGGYFSVIATGPASMGPTAACFDPPDASATSGALANKALLGFPYNASTAGKSAATQRDTDYNNQIRWGWWPATVTTAPGWWVPGDSLWQGCTWVDTPAVSGLVCVPWINNGCVWYGSNANPPVPPVCNATAGKAAAINSQRASHYVYIYDPRDLGAVATGARGQDAVQPVQRVAVQFPGITYPLAGMPNMQRMVTGVSFEPTLGLFAVMVRNATLGGTPTIYWYQVRKTQP